jgi:hypothetical protein
MHDILWHWELMAIIADPVKNRGKYQPARNMDKIQKSARNNLTKYLENLHLLPHSRYLRYVAKHTLKEYIIHDLYLRDVIDTDGINLNDLPDVENFHLANTSPRAAADLLSTGENKQDAMYRTTHDERQAVQLCQLPLTARRLLFPFLNDDDLENPAIYVVTELYFRCPRRYTALYNGKTITLACGRTKRNTTSWIHWYSEKTKGPRHVWLCHCCKLAWARAYKGTRMAVLRTPYHTVQYVCNEPSQSVENLRSATMATYYRKVEGLSPRRDVEHYEDEPIRTTRFDITGDGNQPLTDSLFGPPNSEHMADWLYAMLTKRRHELPPGHPDGDTA